MRRPLLALSTCLAAGAWVGSDVSVPWAWGLLGLGGSLLALALAGPPRAGAVALGACALAIGAAASGAERAAYECASLRGWLRGVAPEGPVRVRGRAAADGRDVGDRWLLLIDVDSVDDGRSQRFLQGRVRVAVGGLASRREVVEGDGLALWTSLRRPRGFGDPAAADAAERALREGIHAVGYCKSPRLVEVMPAPRRAGIGEWAAQVRGGIRRTLERYVLPGAEQGVVRAMVLGDKSGIQDETAEAFRIAGTYHVLALSGAQVALLAALLLAPMRRLGAPPPLQAALVTGGLGFYAILVGGDVPVVRAALMAAALLLGRAADLDSDLANLLGLAAGVLLVAHPSDIGDAGFQLSFAATLGLLLLSAPVAACLPRLPMRLEWALASSTAAQLALAPLLISWFHRLAPAALVLNLLAVPLSSAVLVAGFGVVAAAALGDWAGSVAGRVAWWLGHALLASGQVVEGVPFLDGRLPSPSAAAVAVYFTGLLLVGRGHRRGLAWAITSVGLAALVLGRAVPASDGRLHLEVVDVGQGDCLVLRSPRGRTWMVDAGGAFERPFDFGEEVVGPHLWDAGIVRIDRLLLTHAHPDHAGGVPFVARSFHVGEVWEGRAPRGDRTYAELERRLAETGTPRRTVFRGVRGEWDGVRYEVLSPASRGFVPLKTRNDDSVVLSVSLDRVRLLLAGDIEAGTEAALGAVPATVLKVPHHGSRTSSTPTFLAGVAPRVAVLSVGYRSPFGHPHREVVARYLRAGARLFRTDLDGTVSVSTDGRSVWVQTAAEGVERRLP